MTFSLPGILGCWEEVETQTVVAAAEAPLSPPTQCHSQEKSSNRKGRQGRAGKGTQVLQRSHCWKKEEKGN